MKILIAPDSFKGSVTAVEFCEIAEDTIKRVSPEADVVKLPLADGGEGTVESLVSCTGGRIERVQVKGPLGDPVEAFYGILGDGQTAVIEMASASGLPLVPVEQRNPMKTTTYGTGQLIQHILEEGCTHLIMGIGGSATNDGGAGMLQALGFELLDQDNQKIDWGAEGLLNLRSIRSGNVDARLKNIKVEVACDVDNPLVGPSGAAAIYGPQKGADPAMVETMDQALRNFADCIQQDLGVEVSHLKGAGAAGGLGAGLHAFLNAELKMGFEIIREAVNLDDRLSVGFDLVITGEGQMNDQTVRGKLPASLAKLAKQFGIPVVALVGSMGEGAELVYASGIDAVFSILTKPMTLEEAMASSKEELSKTLENVLRLFQVK